MNTPVITSKLPHVGATIFSTMSKLAADNQAVNLSQGFPDFETDSQLLACATQALKDEKNQYAAMAGNIELRELIRQKISTIYKSNYNPDSEITITAGATQAIFTTINAFVKTNDEVIIIEPAYDCYAPAIELLGAKPVYIAMEFPSFNIMWEKVKAAITTKTVMIIINSPNNPASSLINQNGLNTLWEIIKNTNILVLSDEVYEHMVYDGANHFSICSHPELKKRALIVSSFGKTYHITGWKIGYIVAPSELTTEFRKAHQYNVFCVNSVLQHALVLYMKQSNHYQELSTFYELKRNYFKNNITNPKLKLLPCAGSYFQLVDYSNLWQMPDIDVAILLTEKYKIAGVPVSAFYHNKHDNNLLRFCFAKKQETLDKAIAILNAL